MKRTISAMRGKGSLSHNRRDFIAENVDSSRTPLNIEYRNEDIRTVYHELFDDALARYNEKQTRRDRVIDDYYEKIRTGKQEKPFEELIIQIGNKDNMNASSENGQLARQMFDEYMQSFEQRNPTLRVFSAHLHMDEATPHLHIDFIPFTTSSKRGLETRVSLKKALEALGFAGGTKSHTELNQWIESEKQALASIMARHDIEWEQKGTHEEHLSVLDYKKQERSKEVAALETQIGALQEQTATAETMLSEKQEQLDDIAPILKNTEKFVQIRRSRTAAPGSRDAGIRQGVSGEESASDSRKAPEIRPLALSGKHRTESQGAEARKGKYRFQISKLEPCQ